MAELTSDRDHNWQPMTGNRFVVGCRKCGLHWPNGSAFPCLGADQQRRADEIAHAVRLSNSSATPKAVPHAQ